jgi:hypothetical protein
LHPADAPGDDEPSPEADTMSDPTPERATEPAPEYIDLLEAAHDFGGHIVALAEHHAAKLLREVLARPESAGRAELLERLRELLYQPEYDAIVAHHARP